MEFKIALAAAFLALLILCGCATTGNANLAVAKPAQTQTIVECRGSAQCLTGIVIEVIDGDTIKVKQKRGTREETIRFALVNSPEVEMPGYNEATQYTRGLCPVGSEVAIDEDDGQTEGSYGRMVGLVYCDGVNVNEQLLENSHAIIYSDFCKVSEFEKDEWAKKYGCPV